MLVPRKSALRIAGKQKLVYIHIPKCGGSFVQSTFGKYAKRCPTIVWPEAQGHLTYQEYEPLFRARADRIDDYLLMTVIRNPWAWHVSWFNYVRKDAGGKKSGLKIEHEQLKDMNFQQYLEWLDNKDAPRSPQGYFDKQLSDWICDDSGTLKADIILRQESLYADIVDLVTKLNLAVTPIHRGVNVSTRDDYRSYYSDDGIEQIAKRHHRDISLFQYDFDRG